MKKLLIFLFILLLTSFIWADSVTRPIFQSVTTDSFFVTDSSVCGSYTDSNSAWTNPSDVLSIDGTPTYIKTSKSANLLLVGSCGDFSSYKDSLLIDSIAIGLVGGSIYASSFITWQFVSCEDNGSIGDPVELEIPEEPDDETFDTVRTVVPNPFTWQYLYDWTICVTLSPSTGMGNEQTNIDGIFIIFYIHTLSGVDTLMTITPQDVVDPRDWSNTDSLNRPDSKFASGESGYKVRFDHFDFNLPEGTVDSIKARVKGYSSSSDTSKRKLIFALNYSLSDSFTYIYDSDSVIINLSGTNEWNNISPSRARFGASLSYSQINNDTFALLMWSNSGQSFHIDAVEITVYYTEGALCELDSIISVPISDSLLRKFTAYYKDCDTIETARFFYDTLTSGTYQCTLNVSSNSIYDSNFIDTTSALLLDRTYRWKVWFERHNGDTLSLTGTSFTTPAFDIDSVTITQLSHAKAKVEGYIHCLSGNQADSIKVFYDSAASGGYLDSFKVTGAQADSTYLDTITGLWVDGFRFRMVVWDEGGTVVDTFETTFSQDWLVAQIDTVLFTETSLNYSTNKDSIAVSIYTDCSILGDSIIHKLSLTDYPDSSTTSPNRRRAVKDSVCEVSTSKDTISAIQPDTIFCSAWVKKGESWSNRYEIAFVTAIVPSAVEGVSIDTFYRTTSGVDTLMTIITIPGAVEGQWDADSVIRYYTFGGNTASDSLAENHRWAYAYSGLDQDTIKDTMRVIQPDTVRVYVQLRSNARAEGVWSTRAMAKKYWPAPAADTSKIQDPRVITFYDKRAKTLSHIADEDSLGHANPDTTNPVDWHPYFNFVNNRGVATESVKVTVKNYAGNILCQWAESLVCANTARSRNIVYPSDTVYAGHSIVIQSGQQHSYQIQTKATDSTWTSGTAPQYFYGVIPDDQDTAYEGFRNYCPIDLGIDHDLVGVGHTITVPYPTGWGRTLDTGTVVNTATPAMTSYGKYTITVFQRQEDSTGASWISIIERNDSTGVVTGPVNVLPCYVSDYAHYMPNLVIAESAGFRYVMVVRGSHPENTLQGKNGMMFNRTRDYYTDSTGFNIESSNWTGYCGKIGQIIATDTFLIAGQEWGIDEIKGYRVEFITNMPPHWVYSTNDSGVACSSYVGFDVDSVEYCHAETLVTYNARSLNTNIRLAIVDFVDVLDGAYPTLFSAGGDVFCIFRYRNWSLAPNPIWSTLAYSRYHNGAWSNRRYIAQYTDPGIYRQNSTYYSAYNKPGESRLDILITFRDGYGYENQDRGTAHIWSYLGADTQFTDWYQYDGSDSMLVGYTGLSLAALADTVKDLTDSVIIYRDLTKVIECGNPNIVWENYSTGQDLHEPFMLACQDQGGNGANGRMYFSGNLYVDSSTNSMGNPLYNMFFFYDKSLSEWKRICMSGQTRISAKTKGNHSAYNITITHPNDTLMSLAVSNKWADPETTETFDSIATIAQLWQAVNHGLSGKNGGEASNLVKIDWITDSLLPAVAKCSLKYAVGDSLYSATSFRDTLRELPNGLRQNRLVSEPEYGRAFMYVGYNPEDTSGWFGAEVYRRNLYGVHTDNFPTISRTLLTNNSAEGFAGLTVLPNIAYSTNPNRSRYTATYKQALISRARKLFLYNDRYTAGGMHKVILDYAKIDSTNTTITHSQRNMVTENQFGLLNTYVSFRSGVSVLEDWNSPYCGVFMIMSGNDTATGMLVSPSAVFANVGSEATYGKSFIGFEDYPSYPCTLTNKSYWTIHPTTCSTMVTNQTRQDGGYVLPYQGNSAMIMYDSGYAMIPSALISNRSVSIWAAIVTTGEPYLALKNQIVVGSDTVDTAAVYLGLNKYKHSSFGSQNKVAGSIGGYAWSGGNNLSSSNDSWVTYYNRYSASNNDSLVCTNFGFTVPSTYARVTGIQLTFEGHASDSSTQYPSNQLKYCLVYNGLGYGDTGTVNLKLGQDTTYVINNYVVSLWGNSPTYSIINHSTFGVKFWSTATTSKAKIWMDYVNLKIGYTINEDTVWKANDIVKVQSGSAFTPLYHKFEIKTYSDSAKLYVDNVLQKTYPFTGYNRICLGNWHTGSFDKVLFDALMQRGILTNDVEPKVYFTAEQLLGAESPGSQYRMRARLIRKEYK